MRIRIRKRHAVLLACVFTLLVVMPAAAQEKADDRRGRATDETRDAVEEKDAAVRGRSGAPAGETENTEGEATRQEESRERILRTIRLPRTTEDARESGVPEEEVGQAIETARRGRVPAADAQVVMEEGAHRAHEGEAGNFGSFVNSQLERGLRGQELAAAIHAEKAARGQGSGRAGKGKPQKGKTAEGLEVEEVKAKGEQAGAHLGSKAEAEAQKAKGKGKGKGKSGKAGDAKPPKSNGGRNGK